MEVLGLALFCGVVGLIPASIAHGKGRGFFVWWLFGALLFIFALPAALLAGRDQAELDRRQIGAGGVRKCGECSELIRADAKICHYCKSATPTAAPQLTADGYDKTVVRYARR
jgi:hypothetical protein